MAIPGPPIAVSELLLKGITIERTKRRHSITAYADAFRDTPFRAVRILGTGQRAICLELEDGTLLKITNLTHIGSWVGTRPFDVPVLGRGSLPLTGWRTGINYYLQPKVETPVTFEQLREFMRQLPSNFLMEHSTPENLGIHEGQVRLLDPWAVVQID